MPKIDPRVRSRTLSLVVLCATVAALAAPAGAPAAGPATVTVRAVGLNGQAVLPQTQVTTTTTPVNPDGNPSDTCTGTSAFGALYDATHGNLVVKWGGSSLGYEIDGIEGVTFPAFSQNPDAYWSFWLNQQFAPTGPCGQELSQGDSVVFAAQCIATGPDCSSATAPDHFLTETPPSAAVVQAGTSISVTVGSVSTASGNPESLPAGVSVSVGSASATPDAHGIATLTLNTPGSYSVVASAPDSIPSDGHTICVHNGNDGNCGFAAPTPPTNAGSTGGAVNPAPVAVLSDAVTGIVEGQHFKQAKGPRQLAGRVVADAAGVRSVQLRLERRAGRGGRACTGYNGMTERFVRIRCGVANAPWFGVTSQSTFSYLLPRALQTGRYVLELVATDATGHADRIDLGRNELIFYVG